ncbi:hypothetical protein QTG54_004377 [Skeletonema marinoi]|uniref:Mitochondrial import inner membrane translocase subunit TIM22 n=1 Tax=Skeletonema marinoi TaxID=267567 RepID=A0AAD8YEL1_9STRA|nr:hypothetical protein QTG54_004377 [Skeletonema marinoi]
MGGDSFSSGAFNDPKHVVSGPGLERTIYSSSIGAAAGIFYGGCAAAWFPDPVESVASSAVHLAAQASVPSDKPYYDPRCGFLSLPGPSPLQSALWKLPGMKRRMCGTLLQLEWWGVQ